MKNVSTKDFLKAVKGKRELRITVKGRRTKKARSTTVWFAHEGDKIYLLPAKGSGTNWYQNFLKDQSITLTVDGKAVQVKAQPITKSDRVQKVVDLFTKKYGVDQIQKYYIKLDVAVETSLV